MVRSKSSKAKAAKSSMEVEIERILPGGLGLAHADNQTILVELAAPGDRLRVKIDRIQGKVAFASIIEILQPSPLRIKPPCPYFGRCGGCDFQQLNYETQLNMKVEIIRDCLQRIARINPPDTIPITASPKVWRYRSRAKWQYDDQKGSLGYFELGSHRVCDVVECPVLVPELQAVLSYLREKIDQDQRLPASEFQTVVGEKEVSIAPDVDPYRKQEISTLINGERYQFNADSFFQINQELLEALIKEAVGDARGDSAIDLYCGVGLFTLPLARRFNRVSAVELSEHAVSFARRNLFGAGLTNVTVEAFKVGDWLMKHTEDLGSVDFLLLDPPRSGAENETINGLLKIKPKHISYVSCDPATLARDLKSLVAGGYKIRSIVAFDMFPQTHHVETVVHMDL
jgi:23S rRNA (uracil1939-C5)-methyltransferase